MSTPPPRHGATAEGCPCEECLSARIRLSAAIAADGFKVRISPADMLRSVS